MNVRSLSVHTKEPKGILVLIKPTLIADKFSLRNGENVVKVYISRKYFWNDLQCKSVAVSELNE